MATLRRPGDEFADHCSELLSPLGQVRIKRMFGGHGLYLDGLFIAVLSNQCLYLKVDPQTEVHFSQAGCRRFSFEGKHRTVSMAYWTVPDEAMESPAQMLPWGRLALEAALRARAAAAPAKPRGVAPAPRKTPGANATHKAPRKTPRTPTKT